MPSNIDKPLFKPKAKLQIFNGSQVHFRDKLKYIIIIDTITIFIFIYFYLIFLI